MGFSDIEKNIHILHVVPGLGAGGMELAMARVITGLSGRDMVHSIACFKGDADISDRLPDETGIFCFHSRPNELQLPARLARLVRKIRPDVIHARNWGTWPDMAVGRLLAWPIVPFIYSFHGLGRAGYMPLRRTLASRILARMTTHLFTVSEQSKKMLVSRWGWPEGKTAVISNGVDTGRFKPVEFPRDTERFIVGTVGNLRTVKNHAIIIRTCAELVQRGIDLELRIAGQGRQRENLLALARERDFEDRLILAGRVEDVPQFLNRLDLFVLSSDSEQHPNALNEAMACGIASVSTRVGCAEELLDGGKLGRIIAPGDDKALIDAMAEIISDPGERKRTGQAAREHICKHYSMERMLKNYGEMYRRVSGRGK